MYLHLRNVDLLSVICLNVLTRLVCVIKHFLVDPKSCNFNLKIASWKFVAPLRSCVWFSPSFLSPYQVIFFWLNHQSQSSAVTLLLPPSHLPLCRSNECDQWGSVLRTTDQVSPHRRAPCLQEPGPHLHPGRGQGVLLCWETEAKSPPDRCSTNQGAPLGWTQVSCVCPLGGRRGQGSGRQRAPVWNTESLFEGKWFWNVSFTTEYWR